MQHKITRLQWLMRTLGALDDDLLRPWSDYPCLEWPFRRIPRGYGTIHGSRIGHLYVHRESFRAVKGAIPPRMEICHHCDNPPCFRPAHLFSGTKSDNMQDASRKRRLQIGEDRPFSKMTEEGVVSLIEMRRSGATFAELGAHFGIGAPTAFKIFNRVSWKHINLPAAASDSAD